MNCQNLIEQPLNILAHQLCQLRPIIPQELAFMVAKYVYGYDDRADQFKSDRNKQATSSALQEDISPAAAAAAL